VVAAADVLKGEEEAQAAAAARPRRTVAPVAAAAAAAAAVVAASAAGADPAPPGVPLLPRAHGAVLRPVIGATVLKAARRCPGTAADRAARSADKGCGGGWCRCRCFCSASSMRHSVVRPRAAEEEDDMIDVD
jgi:hypothetical protein